MRPFYLRCDCFRFIAIIILIEFIIFTRKSGAAYVSYDGRNRVIFK